MSEKGLSGLWYDKSKKWELVELPVYTPDDDEIVVRVTATGICGSDLHVTRGDGRDENSPERGPLAMGHEMTVVVHSLGKKVKTDSLKKPLKEGDRVIFPFFFPCFLLKSGIYKNFEFRNIWNSFQIWNLVKKA